ncbi:MAG: hypothetical protein R2704_03230 [Microthrixaceae bacterium]
MATVRQQADPFDLAAEAVEVVVLDHHRHDQGLEVGHRVGVEVFHQAVVEEADPAKPSKR